MEQKEFFGEHESLEFVRGISWDEVFEIWRKNEEHQEFWKEHWEERGYDSWEQWRRNYAKPLNPENLKWSLFRVSDPIEAFPFIFGVPSKGWIKNVYDGEITKQMKDIAGHSFVNEHKKVAEIRSNFPQKTTLTGIFHEGRIVLVEGMHRACVLASWDQEKKFDGEVFLVLAQWDGEIPAIGSGSKKS